MLQALGSENGDVTVRVEANNDMEIFNLKVIALSAQKVRIVDVESPGFTAWIVDDFLFYYLKNEHKDFKFILYSAEGKQLYHEEYSPGETKESIALAPFKSNIYFLVKRTSESREFVKKLSE